MASERFVKQKYFGLIALSMGMITREQLDECLHAQQEAVIPRRLGAIMQARGYLTDSQVREVLSVQGRSAQAVKTPPSSTRTKRVKLFGEILVDRGYIERDTLQRALDHRERLKRNGVVTSLSEVLVSFGKITRVQIKEALSLLARELE